MRKALFGLGAIGVVLYVAIVVISIVAEIAGVVMGFSASVPVGIISLFTPFGYITGLCWVFTLGDANLAEALANLIASNSQ